MMHFHHLTRKHLDVEFTASATVNVRVVERPGLWMSAGQTAGVLADLRSVIEHCLGQASLGYGILSGEKTRLDNAVLTVLYDRESARPLAFSALSLLDVDLQGRRVDVVHTGLSMIQPAFRGRGFTWLLYGATCLVLFARNHLGSLWISNVTQVPSVVGKVMQGLSNVFPTPDPNLKPSPEHLAVARHIMRHHRAVFGVADEAGFDEDRFIITNAYTGGSDNLKKTFADAPKHRDESVNTMCRAQLDYARGDDFLQIGQFDLRAARQVLLRSMPSPSLSAVASRLSRPFASAAPARYMKHLHP